MSRKCYVSSPTLYDDSDDDDHDADNDGRNTYFMFRILCLMKTPLV